MKYLVIMAICMVFINCRGKQGDSGQSIQGPPGVQGEQGQAGESIQGPQGPAGADGTVVQVVPLCPGSSNHQVFVEVALCINGGLYGVYSANGGFLTFLADGDYVSTAIGSDCNLTVSGCTVSH